MPGPRKDAWYRKVAWDATEEEMASRRYIARQLKAAMKGRRIGVTALAPMCGISQPTLSRYLNTKRRITLRAIYKIAAALGYDVEIDIVKREE